MGSGRNDTAIYQQPLELLQQLIRFNTTNPPGNEAGCIAYIDALLRDAGLETTILASDAARPNLIARLKGEGNAPPLLLQGHVDVVTTEKQRWQQPPFEGKIQDGYLWGRGTLDMKGGVAMMIAALLRAKAEGTALPGDVVLTILSDEEAGGIVGAKYLVENHAELFKDIRYALGEVGGFTSYIGGQKFYLIQVVEKQVCWLKATLRGPGGHGSMPMHGGAMAQLGQLLQTLDQQRLPVHVTPVLHEMLGEMATTLDTANTSTASSTAALLRQLLEPAHTNKALSRLGPHKQLFDAILHNTVNATIVHGGKKINVIPSEIVLELDGRLLPGYTSQDMLAELYHLLGNEVEFEVMRDGQGRGEPNLGFYSTLVDVLREADPTGKPVPFLMPAVTDGRYFAELGIQTYGFLPMSLPPDFHFLHMMHTSDERIPVEAMDFGTNAMYEVLRRNKG